MFYIGFQSLSAFIAAIEPSFYLYLAPLSIVKYGEHISTCTVSMVASQVKSDHLIYCKVDVSRWQEIHGEPFGPESEQRAKRAPQLRDQMWQFIVERLRESDPNLELFDGTPSFPADLMLVPGSIEGITYDADLHEFVKEAVAE